MKKRKKVAKERRKQGKKKEKRGNRFGIRDLFIMFLGFCGENR